MQITTKFNIGDVVYFIDGNSLHKKLIVKIQVEIATWAPEPCILYFFNASSTNAREFYKYENEVARTKEELMVITHAIE